MGKVYRYVKCGRSLGEYKGLGDRRFFIVVNGINQYELTAFEHAVWEIVDSYDTLWEWESAIKEKLRNLPNFDLDKVIKKLVDAHIIVEWSIKSLKDPVMESLIVTRQGYAQGLIQGKWVITSSDADKVYTVSKNQYDIWNAGAGCVLLLEAVKEVMEQRSITEDEALRLVVEYTRQLVQLKLWNLEYVNLIGVDG